MRVRVSADDLFEGLMAELVRRGWSQLSLRGDHVVDQAFEAAYKKLVELAGEYGLDVAFRVRCHPLHGDSTVLHESIYSAMQNGMISLESPYYQTILLKQQPDEAERFLTKLPGGAKLFKVLCDEFLHTIDPARF